MTIDRTLAAVTDRIRRRSAADRSAYLERLEKARRRGPLRNALGCTNLAHALAAAPAGDKIMLREARRPNVAIVSSYNDMLSAHQPFERFPEIIKQRRARGRRDGAVRRRRAGDVRRRDAGRAGHGAVAVQPRRDRDGDRGRAVAQHVRRRAVPRHLRQDRAGPADRRAAVLPPAGDLRARRADAIGHLERREGAASASASPRARSAATRCSNRRRSRTTRPAPAPSTAPPTATRC